LAKKAFVYDGTNWIDIAQSTADLSGYPALATNQFGFRNKIINGDFRINQRVYASAANLASGSYGFDRWKSNFTNTTLTFTSAPQGQSVTINSGGGLQQVIERANMPAGTYILSWTGTATARVYNSGGTAPSYAASPVSVTLDGTADVVVEFTASGATKTLQNVQLEAGSKASAFEYRPIGTELALCQRYFWKSYPQDDAPGKNYGATVASATGVILLLVLSGQNAATGQYHFPVSMRNIPGIAVYSLTGVGSKSSSLSSPGMASNAATEYNIGSVTAGSSQACFVMTTQGDGRYASAHITASAEL
jgi:hypothetical protein